MTKLPGLQQSLYPPDWPAISKRIRTIAGWKCESCAMPAGKHPFQLETHHLDGNPQNNANWNLIALCELHHLQAGAMLPWPRTKAELLTRLARQGRKVYFK